MIRSRFFAAGLLVVLGVSAYTVVRAQAVTSRWSDPANNEPRLPPPHEDLPAPHASSPQLGRRESGPPLAPAKSFAQIVPSQADSPTTRAENIMVQKMGPDQLIVGQQGDFFRIVKNTGSSTVVGSNSRIPLHFRHRKSDTGLNS